MDGFSGGAHDAEDGAGGAQELDVEVRRRGGRSLAVRCREEQTRETGESEGSEEKQAARKGCVACCLGGGSDLMVVVMVLFLITTAQVYLPIQGRVHQKLGHT